MSMIAALQAYSEELQEIACGNVLASRNCRWAEVALQMTTMAELMSKTLSRISEVDYPLAERVLKDCLESLQNSPFIAAGSAEQQEPGEVGTQPPTPK